MTPPVIEVPGDITVAATSLEGAIVHFKEPSARDETDPKPELSCNALPDVMYSMDGHEVSCTATDASGNSSTRQFRVTVTHIPTSLDTIAIPDPNDLTTLLELRAHLISSVSGLLLRGKVINFATGGVIVCSAMTDSGGFAGCGAPALLAAVQNGSFSVTFKQDNYFAGSEAAGRTLRF